MSRPPCINCGKTKHVGEAGDRRWYCHRCKVLFDDAPDEGDGDFSDSDPTWRLQREETRDAAAAENARRRR